jgi:hypothetical protein
MSVRFSEIRFLNTNSIDVTVRVEAPIGSPVGRPHTVRGDSTATVPVGVDDCRSVLLAVDDGAHGTTTQTFALAPPESGQGRAAYLEAADVVYSIGDVKGVVRGRTG